MDLSVVIITLNEERNLRRCLTSLPLGAEVIVVDSGSQDQTLAIAAAYGAKIFSRPFDDFAQQKNFGLSQARGPWLLSLDADEWLDEDLRDHLGRALKAPLAHAAYSLSRRLYFMGRLMKYGKTQDRPLRLFRAGQGAFQGKIHEVFHLTSGTRGHLAGGYVNHASYYDLSDYFQRFNRYTSAVAEEHFAKSTAVSFLAHVLRPFAEFFSRYVLRLGFLDGYPGYVYALNSSLYAFTKYSKLYELRKSSR